MNKINIEQYLKAVESRANQLSGYSMGINLSLKERAICEANVFFLNQIIELVAKLPKQLNP